MSEQSSILDRKREVVRAGLSRVAIDLFAEKGFDSVTVDDIAKAAGISARTFFRYFASKDDIVLDLASHLHERLLSAFEQRPPSETAVEALRTAYKQTSVVADDDRARVISIGRILSSSPALRMASFGRPWIDGAPLVSAVAARMGTAPGDQRARLIVAAMSAVATAEWHAWIDEDGPGEPSERIVAALAALDRGLVAVESAKEKR